MLSKLKKLNFIILGFSIFSFLIVIGIFLTLYSILSENSTIAKDDALQKRLEATGLVEKKEKIDDKLNDEIEDLPPEKAELMLPVYKYFTFQLPFVANLSNGKNLVTLELAVSKLLPGLDAENFLEAIESFEPALRSKILAHVSTLSPDQLKTARDRIRFRKELKKLLNEYLTGGNVESKFKIDDVHLLKFVVS